MAENVLRRARSQSAQLFLPTHHPAYGKIGKKPSIAEAISRKSVMQKRYMLCVRKTQMPVKLKRTLLGREKFASKKINF